MNNEKEILNALNVGLTVLNDPSIRIPSNTSEDVSILKNVLRLVLRGDLVIREAPEDKPEKE